MMKAIGGAGGAGGWGSLMGRMGGMGGSGGLIGMGGKFGELAGLTGFGVSNAIREGGEAYQSYLEDAMNKLKAEEAAGRGDISKYYQEGLGFGAPYRQAGEQALGAYEGTLGLGGPGGRQQALDAFRTSPGYQYALHQGLQGVQRGMAARGLSGSGAEMRALQGVGQGLASQEYGQYQQRLAGLAGMGAGQAGQAMQAALGTGRGLAGLGEFYGGREAGISETMGQARAEVLMAKARAEQQEWGREGKMIGEMGGAAASIIA